MNKARRAVLNKIINSLVDLKSELYTICDEEECAYDNMPESLQESERGENMQEAVDAMNDAYDHIEEAVDSLEGIF